MDTTARMALRCRWNAMQERTITKPDRVHVNLAVRDSTVTRGPLLARRNVLSVTIVLKELHHQHNILAHQGLSIT